MVGEIINHMPSKQRDALMSYFDGVDEKIGADVRKAVLTFEELPVRLPPNAAPIVIREFEQDLFLLSMKHGGMNAPDTVAFFFAAVSKRMAEQYREELAALPDPSPEDGEYAQRKLVGAVRRLAERGDFRLNPR